MTSSLVKKSTPNHVFVCFRFHRECSLALDMSDSDDFDDADDADDFDDKNGAGAVIS